MLSRSTLRPWRATLRRSVRLFRAFLVEQTDPAQFYGALADDAVAHVSRFHDLDGALVLDVGGGPGFFAAAFEAAGAQYRAVDADVSEMSMVEPPRPGSVIGSGLALPFRTGCVDVCYTSNVLEHVVSPWVMVDELVRVTKPGGLIFVSFTTWYGPWGGHETAPWHYLGGGFAARRYRRRQGHPPKNEFGRTLFAVTVADGLGYADRVRASGVAEVLDVLPRYNPSWAHWITGIPALRELVTWNLVIVLRRR